MKSKLFLILCLALFASIVNAQQIPVDVTANWVNPTVTTTGLALTGTQALTETQVVMSTAVIPDNFSGTPTAVVTPTLSTTLQTLTIANGGTVHVRIRSCNKPTGVLDCSTWTAEATKTVSITTTPGMPTSTTITINVH